MRLPRFRPVAAAERMYYEHDNAARSFAARFGFVCCRCTSNATLLAVGSGWGAHRSESVRWVRQSAGGCTLYMLIQFKYNSKQR